jgi:lipoyl(octanoyl) transferase
MSWRFLPFARSDASYNMAVDVAILDSHLKGAAPATLRLYEFSPPAVSLGYAQKISKASLQRLHEQGYDVVRRPTGGRAVLHQNDLTYSFIAPVRSTTFSGDQPALSQSVVTAHKEICQALIYTFAQFGIELELGRSQSNYHGLEDCFEATTTADLHFQGRKVVGSAQLRRRSALLQHGSIVLKASPLILSELLNEPKQECARPETKRPGALFEIAGRDITASEFNQAFKSGFGQAFGVSFYDGCLSESELNEITHLKSTYQIGAELTSEEAHRL